MKPSIGQIVHYVGYGQLCVAAMVTLVIPEFSPGGPTDSVCLTAFPPGSDPRLIDHAHHDEDKDTGTWHWPEREES